MSTTQIKHRTKTAHYSAQQRCQAVLSIWTERRKPTQVAKELGIHPALLYVWQKRAMEGMLAALGPKAGSAKELAAALGTKLERLLLRTALPTESKIVKMRERLIKIQQEKPTASAK